MDAGGCQQSLASLSHCVATAALTTRPVKAQVLGSNHMTYYGQCQWEGGAPARASAQLDATFALEGSREVEKVSLRSLSPSLLLMT